MDGSLIVVPLRGREGVAGVLTLERLGREDRFNEEDFELVKLFAAQVSIALNNAEIHRAVEIRARSDGLTGLLNHATFQEFLIQRVREATPFSLIMLDLDDFRAINNEFGHQAGDRLLRAIADSLLHAGRESDHVFRYGGDEFAFLLPGTDGAGALLVAERARDAVRLVGEQPDWKTCGHARLGLDRRGDLPGRWRGGRGDPARGGSRLLRGQADRHRPDRHGRRGPRARRRGRAPGADPGRSAHRSRSCPVELASTVVDARPVTLAPMNLRATPPTGLLLAGLARLPRLRRAAASATCRPANRRRRRRPPRAHRPARPRPLRRRRRPPRLRSPHPTPLVYTVKAGDSLLSIAKRFKTTGRSIAYWNRATYPSLDPDSPKYNPDRIEIGWKLTLTPGVKIDDGPGLAADRHGDTRASISLGPAVSPPADGSGLLVNHGSRESNVGGPDLRARRSGRPRPADGELAGRARIPATFFTSGELAQSDPSARALLAIVAAHRDLFTVGDGTWSEPDLTGITTAGVVDQVGRAEAAIRSATGTTPKPLFRPPDGADNAAVRAAAASAGFPYTILWDVDPDDLTPGSSGGPTADDIVTAVAGRAQPAVHRPAPSRR